MSAGENILALKLKGEKALQTLKAIRDDKDTPDWIKWYIDKQINSK